MRIVKCMGVRLRFQLGALSNGHFDQALFPLGTLHAEYLPRYAAKFDALELAGAYHHVALDEDALDWIGQAPAGFVFNAKLWKGAVAPEDGVWGADQLEAAQDSVEGLMPLADAGRLGTIVAQFPAAFDRTDEHLGWLDDLLRLLPRSAVEFRHPSWFTDDVHDLLGRRSTPLVWSTYDKARAPPWVTGDVGYVRFAGKAFKSAATRGRAVTTRDRLDDILRIRSMLAAAPLTECFVSVLNPFEGNAVDSLARVVAALAGPEEAARYVRKPGQVLLSEPPAAT